MVSRILLQKLRRDLWRQHWQFLATVVVIGIGVAVYVAATDAYANLQQSFDRAYATQLLPDVVISGPGASGLHDTARDTSRRPGDRGSPTKRRRDSDRRSHHVRPRGHRAGRSSTDGVPAGGAIG